MLGTGQQTPYDVIEEIATVKEPYDKLWEAAVKFHRYHDKWTNGPLLQVDAEEVEEEVSPCVCYFIGVKSHPNP